MGLVDQFNKAANTPMSDPEYWRTMRTLLTTEATAIGIYNAIASGTALPTTTEELIKWGDKYSKTPSGTVPSGTFDSAFEISATDKAKLDGWKYRPDDQTYAKYKSIYDNPKYFDQKTGAANWPTNDGFVDGTKEVGIFDSSTMFMRIGGESGSFLGNTTDSFEMRALSPSSHSAEIHYYRPVTNIELTTGEVQPWFDCEGGGIQFVKYKTDGTMYTIEEMVKKGWLEEVFPDTMTGD